MPVSHLAAWLGVAVVVRVVAWLGAGTDLRCSFDGCSYLQLARDIAAGAGLATEEGILWSPGYPAFLSFLVPADGNSAALARLLQSILGALLVMPTAAFATSAARWTAGEATDGLRQAARATFAVHVATAFVALDPTLIAYSHLLWPETLFLLLFVTALALIVERPVGRRAVVAGALLGLAALVKSLGFWLAVPVVVSVGLGGRTGRWRMPLLVLGTALLLIAPWTASNTLRYGRPVFIDVTLGTNLYLGNSSAPPVTWDWGGPHRSWTRADRGRCDEGDFIERDRCEVRRAATWIREHPRAALVRTVTKWADLLNPTSFLVRHVRAGRYRGTPMAEVSPQAAGLATAAAAVPWMALLLLAIVGLFIERSTPARRGVVLMIVGLLLVHALTFGMSRFRLPIVPFLAAYAGLGLAALRSGDWWPVNVNDRLSLLLVIVIVGYLWGLRLEPLLDLTPLPVLQ